MRQHLIQAVHGFLGEALDWSEVQKHLDADFIAYDLFKPESKTLNLKTEPDKKNIFLGYSLGGRLGLRYLAKPENLNNFDHIFLISTNVGFSDDDTKNREQRLNADKIWADQISSANWNNFIEKWNAQDVFKNSKHEPVRELKNYDLTKLKNALVEWSLANQPNYEKLIQSIQDKMTWIVGSDDKKYLAQAKALVEKNVLKDFIILEGGHRLLFDNPTGIAEILKNKLN